MSRAGRTSARRHPGSPAQPGAPRGTLWQTVAACLCLALAVWLVFGQTLHHDFVSIDDKDYVTDNPHVRAGLTPASVAWALTAFHAGNWHPLVWLSLMADGQLHGLQAELFHLTNVLLHLVNALLLVAVVRRMGGGPWQSFFVAALFAVHPLHVESVAWVTARKDVLSALFWLLTLWCYLGYARRPGSARYLATLFFFCLGLMAKPMLMTLPAVLLLADWWPLRRLGSAGPRPAAQAAGCSPWRPALEKLPFIALALASLAVTFAAQQQAGAVISLQAAPLGSRIAGALTAYALYLWKMLWPACLHIPYVPSGPQPWWQAPAALLVLAAITGAAVKTARRHGYFLFGWLWYLATLVPVIGFVKLGVQTMADRYTYIPLIGMFIAIAWAADEASGAWRSRRAVLGAAAAIALAGLAITARSQAGYWKDSLTLWSRTVACDPDNYVGLDSLGLALARQGRLPEAIEQYKQALRLNPGYAPCYDNLGNALTRLGKVPEAIAAYEQALRLEPDNANAHNNYGYALARQGNLDLAIAAYERALRLAPHDATTLSNYAGALAAKGEWDEAVAVYERLLRLNPDDARTCNNLGFALARQGSLQPAIAQYERALQLNPSYARAHANLGAALADLGKPADSRRHFEEALKLATAQNNTELAEFARARLK